MPPIQPQQARSVLSRVDPARMRSDWPVGLRDGALLALAAAGQAVPRAQVEQDGGGLADHEVAMHEEGRREGGRGVACVVQPSDQGRLAAATR